MTRLLALSGLLFAFCLQTLSAVTTSGATAGTWTYDVAAARRLADNTDRPLLVMFSNSSGQCSWCNKFEKEINSSDEWKTYASEQQLAMAYINFNGPNWDEEYYLSIKTNDTFGVTGFPAFVLYDSNGTNVLTAFSYNSTSLTFTAEAFINRINDELGDYSIEGEDIWDPADNTGVGATVLDFQTFNQRQYHTLNDPESTPDDTADWFKFLCVSGRKYKLQIPESDYTVEYTSTVTNSLIYTNSDSVISLPTGSASNSLAKPASTNWVTVASNTNSFPEALYPANIPEFFWVTNGLPFSLQTATNVIIRSSVTNHPPVISNSTTEVHTNLPYGNSQAITNGAPPAVIVPSITLLDPTRQTPLTVDAGPLGYTNCLPLTALTNGCLFTPSNAWNNSYCFIRVSQPETNSVGSFGAEVSQPPVTNLDIFTVATNTVTKTVTQETVSNAWLTVTATTTNIYNGMTDVLYFVITTNLISEIQARTITSSTSEGWSHVTTNACETVTTNFVKYTYGGTAYTLNYRLWEPGEIVFSATNVSTSESSATAKVAVTRKGGSSGSAKVSYRFEDLTAADGEDYKAVDGELFWADGQTGSTNITVGLIQDLRPTWEGDERFAVFLQKHKDASWFQAPLGAASNAVVTLKESASKQAGKLAFSGFGVENAPFPAPANPALTVSENGALQLWISRAGGSNGIASVTVSTASGTAVAGRHFVALSQPLTWADGDTAPQSVDLAMLRNEPYSRDLTFTVKLSGAAGAALGTPSSVTVTVRDERVAYSLADTAAAAAAAGAVFKAGTPLWFWSDAERTTLRSEPVAPNGKAVIQLTLTGPGLLSFEWEMTDWTAPDKLVCSGGVVLGKTLPAAGSPCSVLVKPGQQTVTWTYTKATATNEEAFASLKNLLWQPLPKATTPTPANGARVNPETLSWQIAPALSVTLGGTFPVETNGLDVTRTATALSPKVFAVSNVIDEVTYDELWNATNVTYNVTHKWRVDTAFSNGDGRVVKTGDVWAFTTVNAQNNTGAPPSGANELTGVYEALQGVACDFGVISAPGSGLTYALVGGTLPPGLTLTAATGRLSGVPTKAGTWTVTLQATATAGGVRTPLNSATFTITVYPLGVFAGTYTGWAKTARADLPYSGSGSLTLSAGGDLSAKFLVNGTTYTFSKKGLDGTDSPDAPTCVTNNAWLGTTFVTATDGRRTNTLDAFLISSNGALTASLTLYSLAQAAAGTTTATATIHQVELFKSDWTNSTKKALLTAFTGYYTVSLPVTAARDVTTTPSGCGYLTLTVGTGGSVKLGGFLADGSSLSLSTTLLALDPIDPGDTATEGKSVYVYVCAMPSAYAGNGGLCGLVRLTAGTSMYGNVADCPDASGALQWWNATPTCVYGAAGTAVTGASGFLNGVAAAGGYYDSIMNLQTYYLDKILTFRDSDLAIDPDDDTSAADRLPSDYDGRNGASNYALLTDDGMLPFDTALVIGAQSLTAPAKHVVTNATSQATHSILACIDLSASSNVAGLTLSLARSTGLLSGSFDLVYERENTDGTFSRRTRKVSFKGVHTPLRLREAEEDPSAGVQGGGFYLIPQTSAYIDSTGRNVSYTFNWSFPFDLYAD